jgi:hypothetical protein
MTMIMASWRRAFTQPSTPDRATARYAPRLDALLDQDARDLCRHVVGRIRPVTPVFAQLPLRLIHRVAADAHPPVLAASAEVEGDAIDGAPDLDRARRAGHLARTPAIQVLAIGPTLPFGPFRPWLI